MHIHTNNYNLNTIDIIDIFTFLKINIHSINFHCNQANINISLLFYRLKKEAYVYFNAGKLSSLTNQQKFEVLQ